MVLLNGTTITWYGHACVEIRTAGGRTVLIDPWFGNPLSRYPGRAARGPRGARSRGGHGPRPRAGRVAWRLKDRLRRMRGDG